MRYIPKYRLLQFSTAFKYLKMSAKYSSKFEYKRNRDLRLQFALQLDRIFYRDRYALERFDLMVAGADPLVSMLAALKLGRTGKRVFVYPDVQDGMLDEYYDVCERRYSLFNPGFPRLAGFDTKDSCIDDFLGSVCEQASSLLDEKGEPLIIVADESCKIVSAGRSDEGLMAPGEFWVESQEVVASRGLKGWGLVRSKSNELSVISNDVGWIKRYGTTLPKCLIECAEVAITSYLSQSFPVDFSCKATFFSEASKSILNFDQFTINDRIVDIVELAKLG